MRKDRNSHRFRVLCRVLIQNEPERQHKTLVSSIHKKEQENIEEVFPVKGTKYLPELARLFCTILYSHSRLLLSCSSMEGILRLPGECSFSERRGGGVFWRLALL